MAEDICRAVVVLMTTLSARQDAHEFLSQLLDQLKDEVLAMNKRLTEDCGLTSDTSHDNFPNPTATNFEFEVLHSITCLRYVLHSLNCLKRNSYVYVHLASIDAQNFV